MNKVILLFVLMSSILLGGCSVIDEVNNSLDYAGAVKEHISTLSTFADEAPQLFEGAALNPEIKQELEERLNTLTSDLLKFNQLEAPSIAEGLHQQLVSKNEELMEQVNNMVENGNMAIDTLENSPIISTINNAVELLNRIENLGL